MTVRAVTIKLKALKDGVAFATATDADWEQKAGVKDITPPDFTKAVTEDSYLDSEGWVEKESGDINPGDLATVLAWEPEDTQQQSMYADFINGTKRWYCIHYTKSDVKDYYYGLISSWGKSFAKGETVSRNVTIALSGEQMEADSPDTDTDTDTDTESV